MAYALIAQVEGLNARRTPYAATTKPTDDQVDGFLDVVAAELDANLSAAGVATPVTTPSPFLQHVTHLNALGAAALAEMASFPESDRGAASSPQGDRYWRMYQDGLKALRDGSGVPADAPRTSASSVLARSYGLDNPDGLTETQLAPVFTMQDVY